MIIFLKLLAGRLLAFLRSLPWQAWACAALAILLIYLRSHWIGVGEARVQADFDQYKARQQANADKAKADALGKEQAQRADFAAIQSKLVLENADAHAQIDRLSADLAAGRVWLRARFTCRPILPATAASAGGSEQAGEAGFTVSDADVALGIASDGDAAIRQLTACQSILKSERE